MAIQAHQFIYRGDLSGLGEFHSQVFAECMADGNIVAVYFAAEGTQDFDGDWFLGLHVNGTDVLTGADRVSIDPGNLKTGVTGLEIPVEFRDVFSPTVDERGSGIITGPITVMILVDDGVAAVSNASDVVFTPSGSIESDNVQDAIEELDADTVKLSGNQTIEDVKTFSASPLVPDPTTGFQAVNKSYADGIAQGLQWKAQAVQAASTGPGTLATDFEDGDFLDGVELATGNRILLKDQGDATENGIYDVNASGPPTRSADADEDSEMLRATVLVYEGTEWAGSVWTCITPDPEIGTDDLIFGLIQKPFAQLNALTDVDITDRQDGEILVYDESELQFKNQREFGTGTAKVSTDPTTDVVEIGDIDNEGNETKIVVDDDSETVTITKPVLVPSEPYDAGDWNNNLSVPTKGDVRNKIEDIVTGVLDLPPQSVADEATRFALTDLRSGQLVVQEDTELTYAVINPSELDNEDGWLLVARLDDPGGGGGGDGPDVQVFTTPGADTWTNPAPSEDRLVKIICIGGGGGGGGGGYAASTEIRGGGGGGGGAYIEEEFISSMLHSTEDVVVGGGGAGGAAISSNGNGNNGSPGGSSTFGGTKLVAGGGGYGHGGTTSSICGGAGGGAAKNSATNIVGQQSASVSINYGGGNNATGQESTGNRGANSTSSGAGFAFNGGGGGGTALASPNHGGKSVNGGGGGGNGGTGNRNGGTASAGGAGGASGFASENYNSGTLTGGGGTAGAAGSTSASGSNAGDGVNSFGIHGGAGGGGGGATASVTNGHVGGNGGNGGLYGGGGGGGGAKSASSGTGDAGAGGNGGNGIVVVVTY